MCSGKIQGWTAGKKTFDQLVRNFLCFGIFWYRLRMKQSDKFRGLYVISDRRTGPCKIGIAADARLRLFQLQTGNPKELKLWSVWLSDHMTISQSERVAHAALDRRRLRGEWFDIDVLGVEQVLGTLDDLYGKAMADTGTCAAFSRARETRVTDRHPQSNFRLIRLTPPRCG